MNLRQGGSLALGLTIGMCVTILSFLTLGLFPEVLKPTTELWSVMFGAVLGGGIALAGQVLESQSQAAQKKADKNENDIAHAYDLFGVLNECLSNATFLRKHIETSFSEAEKNGEVYDAICVIELASKSDLPRISLDIKSMLIRRKFLDVYNELGLVDTRVSALLDAFVLSQNRRSELLDLMDTSLVTQGKGFQPLNGREQEAQARNMVLSKGFKELASDLRDDESTLEKCIGMVVSAIQEMGDKDFRFELKK
ncbi:MAG: hypothetical protein ACI9HB_002938 [Gammaproteobacteria bacterium]